MLSVLDQHFSMSKLRHGKLTGTRSVSVVVCKSLNQHFFSRKEKIAQQSFLGFGVLLFDLPSYRLGTQERAMGWRGKSFTITYCRDGNIGCLDNCG